MVVIAMKAMALKNDLTMVPMKKKMPHAAKVVRIKFNVKMRNDTPSGLKPTGE